MAYHKNNNMGNSSQEIMDDLKSTEMLNPFDFYKKHRPEYFSDSKITYKYQLTKEVLQFQLSRLSTDMKQDLFEELTRQLVHRLITPNLIPQTGPTGGGDGKTDIETHPVSDDIAVHWYVPGGGCHGEEKWAMAISCKEKWGPKCDNDIKKIVETERGFTHIHFFTNQTVSSKQKADKQEKIKATYGIELTIYDQNWFLQSIFDNHWIDIAVVALNLSAEYSEKKIEPGPRDIARRKKMNSIETGIAEKENGDGMDTDYIENLLSVAILSRELEEPQAHIKGRFERALRESKIHGTRQQTFIIIYQQAWTDFYWFRNPDSTYEGYKQLLSYLNDEINVTRLEKCMNLLNIITTSVNMGLLKAKVDLIDIWQYWSDLYDKLSVDSTHSSSFLYLKICMLECKILYKREEPEKINSLLDELSDAMELADHHLDIPFEAHCEIVEHMGIMLNDNDKFEDLVDKLALILSNRQKDITAADFQYKRGLQNLKDEKYVQAIRHIGQCISAYQKEPTRGELIKASGMLAIAYKNLDLLYSAKVFFVKSLSLLLHKMSIEGSSDHLIVTILVELCELELRLGQIVNSFAWLQMLDVMVGISRDYADESYQNSRLRFDTLLGIRLLNSSVNSEEYSFMPDILQRLQLSISKDILCHLLGYEDCVSADFKKITSADKEWEQKLKANIEEDIFLFETVLSTQKHSKLQTLINGCTFSISFHSNPRVLIYAELTLAFFESLFSTVTFKDVVFSTPNIYFDVKVKSSGNVEIKEGNNTNKYALKINLKTVDDASFWSCLSMSLAKIFSRNIMVRDLNDFFEGKQKQEHLLDRLTVMMQHETEMQNVLTKAIPISIENWKQKDDTIYKIKNIVAKKETINIAKGKQAHTQITSLIDIPSWNKANWGGCGYLLPRDYTEPGTMMLMFKNFKFGKQIFDQWKSEHQDNKLNLKIYIIKGVNIEHPTWYKVLLTPDMTALAYDLNNSDSHIICTSRFHLMQANDDTNINLLEKLVNKFKVFGLTAVEFDIDIKKIMNMPERHLDYIIPIYNIEFIDAWTIGEHDNASAAILPNDNPYIPSEHKHDAPILGVMKRKKNDCFKLDCL